jgi:hypothetical protein
MEITFDSEKLEQAIKRNPQVIKTNALVYMRDSINALWQSINNTPKWTVGGSGGGVPVAQKNGGNLRRSHGKEIGVFESKIFVDKNKTNTGKWNYAELVHGGTGKMEARPWLRYAEGHASGRIKTYQQRLLKEVVDDLGK